MGAMQNPAFRIKVAAGPRSAGSLICACKGTKEGVSSITVELNVPGTQLRVESHIEIEDWRKRIIAWTDMEPLRLPDDAGCCLSIVFRKQNDIVAVDLEYTTVFPSDSICGVPKQLGNEDPGEVGTSIKILGLSTNENRNRIAAALTKFTKRCAHSPEPTYK